MLVAGLIAVPIGVPVLRLRDIYLAIATIGFGEVVGFSCSTSTTLAGGIRQPADRRRHPFRADQRGARDSRHPQVDRDLAVDPVSDCRGLLHHSAAPFALWAGDGGDPPGRARRREHGHQHGLRQECRLYPERDAGGGGGRFSAHLTRIITPDHAVRSGGQYPRLCCVGGHIHLYRSDCRRAGAGRAAGGAALFAAVSRGV